MDPFQLGDDGLDPKNTLGLPEGLHMKGRRKDLGTLLPNFLNIIFLGLKLHYWIYIWRYTYIYIKVNSYYHFFHESFKIPSSVSHKHAFVNCSVMK